MSGRRSWRNQTLSMPRWAWGLYVMTIAFLGIVTLDTVGFLAVLMAACLSFQFWTIAAFRGVSQCRRPHVLPHVPTENSGECATCFEAWPCAYAEVYR